MKTGLGHSRAYDAFAALYWLKQNDEDLDNYPNKISDEARKLLERGLSGAEGDIVAIFNAITGLGEIISAADQVDDSTGARMNDFAWTMSLLGLLADDLWHAHREIEHRLRVVGHYDDYVPRRQRAAEKRKRKAA